MKKKGALSIDFLISIVGTVFLSLYFLITAFTFVLIETAQYISFASARQLFVSRQTFELQERAAKITYSTLLKNLLNNKTQGSWMKLDEEINPGPHNDRGSNFYGVSFTFKSEIFAMAIPFLSEEGDDFKTTIGSYLGREPSQKECEDFLNDRYKEIQRSSELSYPIKELSHLGNGC